MANFCSCGEVNKDGALYCNRCGARLGGDSDTSFCPRCGYANPGSVEFCRGCGGNLTSLRHDRMTRADARATTDEESWAKTYGSPGFYESTIREGPGGARIETEYSFLGIRESSSYPRWMITSIVWAFVMTLFLLGFVLIKAALDAERTDIVAYGFGVVGMAVLAGYILYRVYYTRPRARA